MSEVEVSREHLVEKEEPEVLEEGQVTDVELEGQDGSEEGIETLSQFIKFTEELPKEFTLSRGQSRDLPLLPSGLRKDNHGVQKFRRGDLNYFLDEFKVYSHNYIPIPTDPHSDWEWMIYAQHYGVPTRLLDFTFSHILSLMFAVENAFNTNQKGNAVVWFLNPSALNSKNSDRTNIINVSKENLSLDNYDGPVAIQSRKLNERINSQNGVFAYFQDNEDPLEETLEHDILRKLVIKEDYLKDIMSSLNNIGIGFSHLYPELSSVSKDILTRRNVTEYVKEKEDNV